MPNESIIQIFEGKKVRVVWNEQEEKYFFAVADIVELLTDSADVKQYIKRMRSRDAELDSVWGTICTPHQFVSSDGKKPLTNLYPRMEKNMRSIVPHWKASSESFNPSPPKKPNP